MLGAYLLSACSGGAPVPSVADDSQSGQLQEIVFTGTVESIGDGQWLVSGQQVSVDAATSVDANVQVGDIVRVEASVSPDGSVAALKIETSGADDGNTNSDTGNSNDANANDDNTNTGDDNGNDNSNSNNNAPAGPEQEVLGAVEAITTDSITIDGVTYSLADFTEFKGVVVVGDQVKVHVIVNADGSLTIREIEKVGGTGIGDDNGNSNDNGDDNSNGNSNDDNNDNGDDDNSNHNSNDDDSGGNSNSNDD